MLHLVNINRRTDLASAPWEIVVNGADISLHDQLPTQKQVDEAIERYTGLTSFPDAVT